MYLTSMSREELYAEAHKDLIAISTKANMFIDKVRKKAAMTSPFPVAPQRMTITTTRKNVWTLEGDTIHICMLWHFKLTLLSLVLQAMAISK